MADVKSSPFSVEIETWGPSPGADEQLADLVEALAALGADGAVTSVGGLAGGVGAAFGVDATRSRGSDRITVAVEQSIERFEEACRRVGITHGGIARVDVMTDAYLDRWLSREPERYAGVSEVAALFGVSRQRVAELRAKPGFPAPLSELAAGPVWKVSSLQRFLETWDRRPGRPRKAKTA